MLHRFIISLLALACWLNMYGVDPTATQYSWDNCQGSAKPYPAPEHPAGYPDTLRPVMINHVGRHGARFPASPRQCNTWLGALRTAEARGTLTPLGKKMLALTRMQISIVDGRWGALDSLGMAEQRGIAARMIAAYPHLFKNSLVKAISSYSPRCIMSMDEFTHQLARMDNTVELDMGSGRRYSPLMRFFDGNADYTEFRASEALANALHEFTAKMCPTEQLKRVLGKDFDFDSYQASAFDLARAEFAVLTGFQAMGYDVDASPYLTVEEANALWAMDNLHHYLEHSSSTLSTVPSAIAASLLEDLIATTDSYIAMPESSPSVHLRFGHAETLMPLLALMHLRGCYYLTNYFDTVASHWRDFDIVPMAANLQLILFRSDKGHYYVRVDLNEQPIPLMPDSDTLYLPWAKAKDYMQRCLPLF